MNRTHHLQLYVHDDVNLLDENTNIMKITGKNHIKTHNKLSENAVKVKHLGIILGN